MKYRCNSVNWSHTSQSSFSQSFYFLSLSRGYLWSRSSTVCLRADSAETRLASFSMKTMIELCQLNSPTAKKFLRRPLCRFVWGDFMIRHGIPRSPRQHSRDSTNTVLANSSMKEWFSPLKWIHTSQSSFSESFLPVFLGGDFPSPYTLQTHPKYQFSESTRTVLGNGSKTQWCNSVSWSHVSERNSRGSLFHFWSEGISFVTASCIAPRSISLQISGKRCRQTDHWKV